MKKLLFLIAIVLLFSCSEKVYPGICWRCEYAYTNGSSVSYDIDNVCDKTEEEIHKYMAESSYTKPSGKMIVTCWK